MVALRIIMRTSTELAAALANMLPLAPLPALLLAVSAAAVWGLAVKVLRHLARMSFRVLAPPQLVQRTSTTLQPAQLVLDRREFRVLELGSAFATSA